MEDRMDFSSHLPSHLGPFVQCTTCTRVPGSLGNMLPPAFPGIDTSYLLLAFVADYILKKTKTKEVSNSIYHFT